MTPGLTWATARHALHGPIALAGAAMLLLTPAVCGAQERDTAYTVAERFASVLQPEGVPFGAMRLYPRVGAGLLRTDNVFASDTVTESDWATTALAEAVLSADTSLYRAELGARGDFGRFSDFDNNDYDNGRLWLAAVRQMGRGDLSFDLDFASLNEPRTSVDAPELSTELIRFTRRGLSGAYRFKPGRFSLRIDGNYQELDFDDVDTPAGPFTNGDRSRTETDFGVRLGFDVADSYGFFFEPRISTIEYDQRIDDNGFERGRDGYDVRFGTDLRFTGVLTGEFYLGYLSRDFDDPRFGKAQGPSYGARLDWVITPLTTLNIGGERTTRPTTIVDASTTTNTTYGLRVDHELLRNLVVRLAVEQRIEDFEGTQREDEVTFASLSAEYRLNRNWWLDLAFRRNERDTEPPGLGGRIFEINEISLNLTYQL